MGVAAAEGLGLGRLPLDSGPAARPSPVRTAGASSQGSISCWGANSSPPSPGDIWPEPPRGGPPTVPVSIAEP